MNTLSQSLVSKRRKFSEIDFYPTPESITKALMDRESFEGSIIEPACGNGAMSKVIKKYNKEVYSSDIQDLGYGDVRDFLDFVCINAYDNVITNPPFIKGEEFVRKAKLIARKKIAIFHRLLFLESSRRYSLFNDKSFPLSKVYVFCKRQNLFENGEKNKVSGTVAFAWFVWNKEYRGEPTIEWINEDIQKIRHSLNLSKENEVKNGNNKNYKYVKSASQRLKQTNLSSHLPDNVYSNEIFI